MKDTSLELVVYHLTIVSATYRNVMQKGVNALPIMVLKHTVFDNKKQTKNSKVLYILDHTIWFKLRQDVVQIRIK